MQSEDDRIDALVRAMRRDQGEPAATIPAEVVHAYLTGRATAAQKTQVRQALVASPQFRAELVDLSNYLETLSSDSAASAYDAAAAPVFVQAAAGRAAERVAPSLWQQLTTAIASRLTMPRILVVAPALTAAVLVIAVLPRVTWSPLVPPTATTAIEATRFATPPGISRGEGEIDAEQAALRVLHDCVRAREDGWEIGAPAQTAQGTRLATVHWVDAWRRKLRTVAIALPAGAPALDAPSPGTDTAEVGVWVLSLPAAGTAAGKLQSFTTPAGASMALRQDGAGQRYILVATYLSGGRYFASPCITVDGR